MEQSTPYSDLYLIISFLLLLLKNNYIFFFVYYRRLGNKTKGCLFKAPWKWRQFCNYLNTLLFIGWFGSNSIFFLEMFWMWRIKAIVGICEHGRFLVYQLRREAPGLRRTHQLCQVPYSRQVDWKADKVHGTRRQQKVQRPSHSGRPWGPRHAYIRLWPCRTL